MVHHLLPVIAILQQPLFRPHRCPERAYHHCLKSKETSRQDKYAHCHHISSECLQSAAAHVTPCARTFFLRVAIDKLFETTRDFSAHRNVTGKDRPGHVIKQTILNHSG